MIVWCRRWQKQQQTTKTFFFLDILAAGVWTVEQLHERASIVSFFCFVCRLCKCVYKIKNNLKWHLWMIIWKRWKFYVVYYILFVDGEPVDKTIGIWLSLHNSAAKLFGNIFWAPDTCILQFGLKWSFVNINWYQSW